MVLLVLVNHHVIPQRHKGSVEPSHFYLIASLTTLCYYSTIYEFRMCGIKSTHRKNTHLDTMYLT